MARLATTLLAMSPLTGILLPAALVGCDSPRTARSAGPQGGAADWPFWPREMRVHPLSQIRSGDDPRLARLDLRLEFNDADGIDVRAVGVLSITATTRARGANATTDMWTVDLVDPTVNRRTFDTVTRTYHVRRELRWNDPASPDHPHDRTPDRTVDVTVVFDGIDGRSLRQRAQFHSR